MSLGRRKSKRDDWCRSEGVGGGPRECFDTVSVAPIQDLARRVCCTRNQKWLVGYLRIKSVPFNGLRPCSICAHFPERDMTMQINKLQRVYAAD